MQVPGGEELADPQEEEGGVGLQEELEEVLGVPQGNLAAVLHLRRWHIHQWRYPTQAHAR